jgi:hypothetical protein
MRVYMNDESKVMSDEDNMAEVELELNCITPDCTSGVAGACWKTTKLPAAEAMAALQLHLGDVHGQRQAGGGAHRGDGGVRSRQERLTRPTISAGSNQHDFKLFIEQWNQYKEFSGETDADLIRNQLMKCPIDELFGDRADMITEADLLKEIEMLVVERQSNLLNTVALMSVTRERGE